MAEPVIARLTQIQEEEGKSNSEFARLLGIDPSMWWLLKKGKRRAGRKVLDAAIRLYPDVADVFAQSLKISDEASLEVKEVA